MSALLPTSVWLWSGQWSFQWNQRHDSNQLSAAGGGLCKAHQVILHGGEKPILGRKTRQDKQASNLWEQGGHRGRRTCVCYLFMVNWTVAVGTTRHPWPEGKQQFVACDSFGPVGTPSKLSGVVKVDCGACALKDTKNGYRTR